MELQCYTSLSSVFILVPTMVALVDFPKVWAASTWATLGTLLLGGLSFHCQSFTEYILLGYISPVTHRYRAALVRLVYTREIFLSSTAGDSIC